MTPLAKKTVVLCVIALSMLIQHAVANSLMLPISAVQISHQHVLHMANTQALSALPDCHKQKGTSAARTSKKPTDKTSTTQLSSDANTAPQALLMTNPNHISMHSMQNSCANANCCKAPCKSCTVHHSSASDTSLELSLSTVNTLTVFPAYRESFVSVVLNALFKPPILA